MDIYIRGMEMPKVSGRIEAVITILKDGAAQIAISPADDQIGYWKEYPLIPLPPHGRLVDADVLEQDAQKRLLICNKYNDQFQKPYEVMRAIALAPTVIPAEEDE